MKRPHLLLTNDDGITSEGLFHLYNALKDNYTLSIVAPSKERSGAGASLTYAEHLEYKKFDWQAHIRSFHESQNLPISLAYSVTGSPVDCVKTALSLLIDEPIDMVISGINHGSNAGRNVLYSGTVGACMEAAMREIPSIAVSCLGSSGFNWTDAYHYLPLIIEYTRKYPLPRGSLLNVNIPKKKSSTRQNTRGIKLCGQGRSYWIENPTKEKEGDEHCQFILGGKMAYYTEHEQSDVHALNEGWISATPLQVDDLSSAYYLHQHNKTFTQLSSQPLMSSFH